MNDVTQEFDETDAMPPVGAVDPTPLPRLKAAVIRLQRKRPPRGGDSTDSGLYGRALVVEARPDDDHLDDAPTAERVSTAIHRGTVGLDDATVEHAYPPPAPGVSHGASGHTELPEDCLWYEGLTIADKYVLIEEVAHGAWGAVWRADQKGVQRSVAIKVLHPREERALTAARQRFEREARLASRIRHPSAVRIFDYGLQKCSPYLVMEWLDGTTLADTVALCGALPPEVVEPLVRATVGALRAAHDEGVIHRDVKPGNIMLVESSQGLTPVVVDFGLARTFEDDEPTVTRADMVIGTPAYMSPEAIRGETISPLSDIYSLGVSWIEALLGYNPWRGASSAETMTRHLMCCPIDTSALMQKGCTPAFAAVLLKMVSLEPDERPQSAHALEQALLALAATRAPVHKTRALSALPMTEELLQMMRKVEWRRKSPALALIVALCIAVIVTVGAIAMYRPAEAGWNWSIRSTPALAPYSLASTHAADEARMAAPHGAADDAGRIELAGSRPTPRSQRPVEPRSVAARDTAEELRTAGIGGGPAVPALTLPAAGMAQADARRTATSSGAPHAAAATPRDTASDAFYAQREAGSLHNAAMPLYGPERAEPAAIETAPTAPSPARRTSDTAAVGRPQGVTTRRRDTALPAPAAIGTLVVTASPAGRMVIDGKDYGIRSTLVLRDLALRSYTVELHRDGASQRRTVALRADTRHVERFHAAAP